jgi:hypothetical protein
MMDEIAELPYRLTGYEDLVQTLSYNSVEKSVVGSSLQTPNPDNTIHSSKFKRNFLAKIPDKYPFQKIHVKHERMIEVVCSTLFKTDHNQMNRLIDCWTVSLRQINLQYRKQIIGSILSITIKISATNFNFESSEIGEQPQDDFAALTNLFIQIPKTTLNSFSLHEM